MGAGDQSLGLRDRKKIQTRNTIQREAMRLIDANGYANTTIEQIADAAEIATSTFFRYFPNKESVLIANDLDQVTIDALSQQPADIPGIQAFRRAVELTFAAATTDTWKFERDRLRIVLSIPELKSAQIEEYHRTIARLAEAESRRTGRDPDDFEPRVFIGALAGGLMAALDGPPHDIVERMYRTLDFIEAGMPL